MSVGSLGLNAYNVSALLNAIPFVITEEVSETILNILVPEDPTFFDLIPATLKTGMATIQVAVTGEPKTGSFSQYDLTIGFYDEDDNITTYASMKLVYVPDEDLGNAYSFIATATLIKPVSATKIGIIFVPGSLPYTDFTTESMIVSASFIQFSSV
jgi:hypothetical protein